MTLLVTALISFIIILCVTALVRGLRLGEVRLESRAQACDWAMKNVPFFTASEAIISEDGQGALVSDHDGRIVLIKRHGSKFAGRLLERPLDIEREGPVWCVGSGDRQFGRVSMQFDIAGQHSLNALLQSGK